MIHHIDILRLSGMPFEELTELSDDDIEVSAERLVQLAHYVEEPPGVGSGFFLIRAFRLALMPEYSGQLTDILRELRLTAGVQEQLSAGRPVVERASALGTGNKPYIFAIEVRERPRKGPIPLFVPIFSSKHIGRSKFIGSVIGCHFPFLRTKVCFADRGAISRGSPLPAMFDCPSIRNTFICFRPLVVFVFRIFLFSL